MYFDIRFYTYRSADRQVSVTVFDFYNTCDFRYRIGEWY